MTSTTEAETLPRWDLSNIYSGLEAGDYQAAVTDLGQQITDLEKLFDQHGIRRQTELPKTSDAELTKLVVDILGRVNRLARLAGTLDSFVYGSLTTNSYDSAAVRETSRLELLDARRKKVDVRLQGWIGSLAARLPALIKANQELKDHEFYLLETARQSKYLMPEQLEALAADMAVDAGLALGKLQGNTTSQLKVPFERNGAVEVLPITVIRNLSFDPDPVIRERAYHVELDGWNSLRTTVAACLNGVKGTATTLARWRGRESVLAVALDDNRIDQATLDAMLGAIREALPMFRRYMRAKARHLGLQQLRWWDLFAPLGSVHKTYSWQQARDFIVEKFGTFSPGLGKFAARSFDERWIDAGPRDGKRGGAYCMEVLGTEESRVLANFDGSFEQVSTLAHELGHAFHNDCQTGLPPLRRGSPATLAETASIFCETLVAEATIRESTAAEQLTILEAQLCNANQVCVDILSRFLFESAVFDRRPKGELTADELCELMLAAQAETYGDAVDPSTYHRYMWLWKPHYYAHAYNFYNFPYAFGHLFSLGLYAIYQQEGVSFVPRYQELLRSTAQAQAADLAQRFGIDIRGAEFWRASLRIVGGLVDRFEKLEG